MQRAEAAEAPLRAAALRDRVERAVEASPADGILLSAGLDTSVVASVAAAQGRRLRAVTVCLRETPGSDGPFAEALAARLGFPHTVLRPSLEELADRLPEAIAVLGSFDPMELRNSVVLHAAIAGAREEGATAVLTGDAADELFAGYGYMQRMPAAELPRYLRWLDEHMRFASQPLARALGLRAELPYLHPLVRELALQLEASELVGERGGRRYGKRILRLAFQDRLPPELVWRVKAPIEYGSGSTALRDFAERRVDGAELDRLRHQARQEGVRLRDPEHAFCYRAYRRVLPPPGEQPGGAKRCPDCRGPVDRAEQRYCRTCGAYPLPTADSPERAADAEEAKA